MKKLRVVVLMGGRSSEHEVSLISGQEVVRNFDKIKFQVVPLVIPKKGQLPLNSLVSIKPDVVFIALHGPYGEDGTVQGLLELLGVPYIGARVLASALGIDKIMFRKVMEREKIPIPKYLVVNRHTTQKQILSIFDFPFVIKPSDQGSSIGVSIVRKKIDLKKALTKAFAYSDILLAEEYIAGTEITCAVIGNKNPVALPVVEIRPKKEFFDYEAKYQSQMSDEIVPAMISEKLTKKVQQLAIDVYQAIECRGFGRVDMIIRKDAPYVLEINTIPGLTPNSLLPKAAQAGGISFPRLLDRLIELALEK